MAFKPRLEIPGHAYHLTANAVDGTKAFRDDDDRERMLNLVGEIATKCGWIVPAYSVLSTHYHLLIVLTKATLSRELLRLFGTTVQAGRRVLRSFVEEPDPRKRRSQIRVRDRSGPLFGT